jgi:ribosomal protein S27E
MCENHFEGSKQTLVFDCPVPRCDTSIIGRYIDLKRHILKGHDPLVLNYEDPETGKNFIEQIEDAQSNQLKRRIEEEMVVTDGGQSPDAPRGFDRAVCDECGHVAYLPEDHPDGVVSCTDCGKGTLSREGKADV